MAGKLKPPILHWWEYRAAKICIKAIIYVENVVMTQFLEWKKMFYRFPRVKCSVRSKICYAHRAHRAREYE